MQQKTLRLMVQATLMIGTAIAAAVFYKKHKANDRILTVPTQKSYYEREITLNDGSTAKLKIREIGNIQILTHAAIATYRKKLDQANEAWEKEGKINLRTFFEYFKAFPKGQIGAYMEIDGQDELVGMITSVRMNISNPKRDMPRKYNEVSQRLLWLNKLIRLLDFTTDRTLTLIVQDILEITKDHNFSEDINLQKRLLGLIEAAKSQIKKIELERSVRSESMQALDAGLGLLAGNTLICPRVDVLPEYRDYGIAKLLVQAQLQLARNFGCSRIFAYSRATGFKPFNETLISFGITPTNYDQSLGQVVVSFKNYLKIRRPWKRGRLEDCQKPEKPKNYMSFLYGLYEFYMQDNWRATREQFLLTYGKLFTNGDEAVRTMSGQEITKKEAEQFMILFDYINFLLRAYNKDYPNWRIADITIGMHSVNGAKHSIDIENSTPNDASGNRNTIMDYSYLL
ncbi:GNAT family N-acetyltransferase [Candidatus Micrarchaeota archaeon]|nr:GNAT family N-acetyltransferase [Candidatus Micrarchaeota archaeon]